MPETSLIIELPVLDGAVHDAVVDQVKLSLVDPWCLGVIEDKLKRICDELSSTNTPFRASLPPHLEAHCGRAISLVTLVMEIYLQ